MKHTPGPWWYQEDTLQKIESEENCKEFGLPLSKHKHISVHGTYPGGIFVAYCGCHKETLANARLIAAAPETKQQRDELLKACKMMLRLIEGENLDEKFDGEAEVLRDAIAKAESEVQNV